MPTHRLCQKHLYSQKGFTIIQLSVMVLVMGMIMSQGVQYTYQLAENQEYDELGNKLSEHSRAIAEWIVDQGGAAVPGTKNGTDWLKSNADCGITGGGSTAYLPCSFSFTSGRYGETPTTVVTNTGGVTKSVTVWPGIVEGGDTKAIGAARAVNQAEADGRDTLKGVVQYTEDNSAVITATVDINNGTSIYVKRSGDTMTGALDMGGNNLNNVGVITATTANVSTLTATGSVSAPVFFDSNNSSYKVDANGTSRLNFADVNYARLNNNYSEGAGCSTKVIGTTSKGELMSCVSGKWTKPGGGVDKGLIAAFNGSCPSGWSQFTSAKGRTLVGSGYYSESYPNGRRRSWSYSVGQRGGKAFHQLTEAELASHGHMQNVWNNEYSKHTMTIANTKIGRTKSALDWRSGNYHTWRQRKTYNAGSNIEHENRSPYYIVSWCQKT